MSRWLLTLVVLVTACKDSDHKKKGPPLTPATANQLKAIAPECEIRASKGSRGTQELRLCKGPQAMMTIHLTPERDLIEIEIGLWASMFAEARLLVEQTVRGIVSDNAIAALTERMQGTKSNPVVIDGVRVDGFYTQAPNENPRYTAVLSW